MAKGDTKMIYDQEEDILSLSKGRKVKASIDIGDFIIDIDTNGFVSGIEVQNASKNLNIAEEQLSELQRAQMTVNYKPHYVYIHLLMQFKQKEQSIAIPLTVNIGQRRVRTEKTSFAA